MVSFAGMGGQFGRNRGSAWSGIYSYFRNVERYNSPFTEFSDYSIAQVDDTFTDGITDAQFEDKSKMPAKEYAMMGYELSQQYPEFFPLELHEKALTDIEKLNAHPYQVSNYLYQTYRQMQENDMNFVKLVYGHTHLPCYNQVLPFGAFSEGVPQPPEWASQLVDIYNTGGWVNISDSSTLDIDNTTVKSPNPMFLHKNGTISKATTNRLISLNQL